MNVSKNLLIFLKPKKALLLILGGGLLLRLFLSPISFHPDVYSLASWGKWIYENGPKGFYENRIWIYEWPTQFPVFNLLMLFCMYFYKIIYLILKSSLGIDSELFKYWSANYLQTAIPYSMNDRNP